MRNNNSTLTIFHMDFNHVSLRENYIRTWLGQLAEMGYNAILWEIEDKVRWETCSAAVWPEAMTKKQFRSILDYSRKLGLEPIPLLQTVGHAEYVLKQPEYVHMREQPERHDCYCTSNPAVRKFLKKMVTEYLDLFGDIHHFHLGGDEAYVFATCPECKAAAGQSCRNKIYADHIMDVAGELFTSGVRPGIWCDMVLHYPKDIEFISKKLTIWDWNYWDGLGTPQTAHVWGKGFLPKDKVDDGIQKSLPEIMDADGNLRGFYTTDILQRLGYEIFLCSSTRCYADTVFCGRHGVHSHNVIGAAKKSRNLKLLGHCVTSWAVRVFNMEIQDVWLAMTTECNSASDASYDEIVRKVGKDILGIEPTEFYSAIEDIAAPFIFAVTGYLSGIQWSGMKDSMPAPAGFIKNLFQKLKNENDGKAYAEKLCELKDSIIKIDRGYATLKNIAGKVTNPHGCKFVAEWLTAADFQMRMAKIVERAFDRFESGNSQEDTEGLAQTSKICGDYEKWALHWMTPQSARQNAELVFNPLIEWFSTMS